jgi:aminopeptidase
VNDPRIDRLAALLLDYSLELDAGKMLRIEGPELTEPLLRALHRGAIDRGAHSYVHVQLSGLEEILLEEGSAEQLQYLSEIDWAEMNTLDAVVTVWGTANTRSLTRLDPIRVQQRTAARRKLTNHYWDRLERGESKWVGTLFPTNAHAQDAGMSLAEYEQFVFGACHVLEGEDPGEYWRSTSGTLAARAAELDGVSELRIVGPDTDLRVIVEGRGWQAADGKLNMPDGEVFSSPVEDGTEGEVRFTFPAIFDGREVEDVRLRFEGGRVVADEAAQGGDYLRAMLDMDAGARVLGEVAFGLNYEIDRFTGNILFDEKIGGTMHLALGSAFKHLGGRNESGLHWDMICDLREGGEVYADGELIWKNGAFVADTVPAESPSA